jgi:thiamine kinase-like enzyme
MSVNNISRSLLKEIINKAYQLSVIDISQQQGGWASLAFKVKNTENKKYFLKVYEKARASTQKLTKYINYYMPVIDWLNEHSDLNNKIIQPIKTVTGEYKYEDSCNIYLLTNYIEGTTIGEKGLSPNQVQQLADIISELHSFTKKDIPLNLEVITEDFDVSFSNKIQELLLNADTLKDDIKAVLLPYLDNIYKSLEQLLNYSERLKKQKLNFVLCHRDIHHWNLRQASQNLVLIDWEGLNVAPPEADICLLHNQPYFKTFYTLYKKRHPDYILNQDVLLFYKHKRKLEDIFEFIEQLQFDSMTEQNRKQSLYYLTNECTSLL